MGQVTAFDARHSLATGRMPPDRVEWHLWNWERWMQHSRPPGKMPGRASGGLEGYTGYDGDCTEQDAEADRFAGAAVQAVLDGLPDAQRMAVYFKHGIVKMVGIRDIDASYAVACSVLASKLPKRGLC